MAPKTAFHEVPQTIQDWRKACQKAGVQRSSINSFLGMHSGSEVTQGQYLLMRVLYPRQKDITAFDPATYSLTQEFQDAIGFLDDLPVFRMFLQAIETNPALSHEDLGIFAIPRMNQLLIQRAAPPPTNNVQVQTTNPPISSNSRSRTAAAAAAAAAAAMTGQLQQRNIDEEVINVHMITFLQALTGTIPDVLSEWNPHRFAFQTQFATDKYEARTDGYLRVQSATGKVQAIVEVKRGLRRDHKPDLEMQEAAEMVGWIMDNGHRPDPSLVGRHLLVSQTYTEVWLTFASFDQNYVKYLRNQKAKQSFLRMQRYGPYQVANAGDMKRLSQVIVAFVMRAKDGL